MKLIQMMLGVVVCGVGVAQTAPLPSPSAGATAGVQRAPEPARQSPAPGASGFPPPPGRVEQAAVQTSQTGVQQSNHGPGTYAPVRGSTQSNGAPPPADYNGVAPLPPLAPPTAAQTGQSVVSPFSPREIVNMRDRYESTRKAKAYKPVRTVPRISSITVDLSPGSAPPVARVMPGETSTLVFLDASGAPWPLATTPRVSDARYFDAEWLQGTATLVISALSPYEEGNLSVMLQGSPTPVVIKLVSGEPDSTSRNRVVDYRLDLRIPGRAPGTPEGVSGSAKIALYDDTMQAFLDGLPPRSAKPIKMLGTQLGKTRIWVQEGALYVRTEYDIQSAFDQTIASADGTRVYRLAPTPFIAFSQGGSSLTVQLDID